MNRTCRMIRTQIERKCIEQAESIEEMLRRIGANNEPIPDNVPPIYTPRDEGVLADYDIRTDRFDIAMEATDKFTASQRAQSANKGEMDNENKQTMLEV